MRTAGTRHAGGDVGLFSASDATLAGADDVLVRSLLTPVNPADALLLTGVLTPSPGQYPIWAGVEVVGTVEAIGPAVEDLSVGDTVLAGTSFLPHGHGTHAELTVISHRYRAALPAGSDPARFAGLPVAAGAALLAFDLTGLDAGAELAVTGASGAVGRIVVGLARLAGVRVTGLGRSTARAEIGALGCEAFLDTAALDGSTAVPTFDAVVDAAALGAVSTRLARIGATVIALRPFIAERQDVRVVATSVGDLLASPSILRRAVELVETGALKPPALEPFAADDIAPALDRLTQHGRRGVRPVLVW